MPRPKKTYTNWLIGATAIGLILIAAVLWLALRPRPIPATAPPSGALQLTFDMPCAPQSSDAGPFYAALRARDKSTLSTFLANKKILMVKRATPLTISPDGPLAKVAFGDPKHPTTCYIPADVVSSFERNSYR